MDRGVIATADELFEARHYPGVVALVSDALDEEPECVPLLVIRARAHIALRRDLDAQAALRDIIRLDPQCGTAYRLLGELAARRDENESAAIFFREALRLDPGDREASDWLQVVGAQARPAAVATKLPAPAAAAGRFPRARTANDGQPRSLSSPARAERPGSQPRFARGTHAPDEEVPTHRMGSASIPSIANSPARMARADSAATFARRAPTGDLARGSEPAVSPQPVRTLTGRPPTRPMTRGTTPELPGFGDYLVETGILTRERLRAAQAYQRSMKVQLSTAIVTLGLATPQRIEWAAVAHQSQLGQQR